LHRFATAAAALAALAAGGCAYRLDSIFPKSNSDVEQTGSIVRPGQELGDGTSGAAVVEIDLAYARATAADVLARGGRDVSIPWENPHTGAGGNITPLAASYNEGSFVCRDFLASYVRGQAQSWLQGEACRAERGPWEVRSLKPLKQG
jgi:surface antigen